jgi:tRNA (guanine-N7-)-methyltransferase
MSASPTENSNVTEKYRTILSERRQVLREQVETFIPPGATFVWEIGSGHGHFLTAYAQAHPTKLCAGIDIVGERVERALRKRDRARLANLSFFRAEARLFLQTLPAGAKFADIFVLFPDPWPKLRHHKHRIMQPAFLASIADHATPDCRLHFRTDFAPYFEDTLEVVRAHPKWELAADPWPFEFATVFQRRAPSFQSLVARLRP